MKFSAAMKDLEEGKKVYCKTWKRGRFIYKGLDGMFHGNGDLEVGDDALSEWELYEEPEKTLNFMQVVQGLKEGKEFRRLGWKEDRTAIHMGYYTSYVWNESQVISGFTVEDFEAIDWIEVK